MRASKPAVKAVLGEAMRRSFKVRKPQFADKSWRISTDNSSMTIRSLVKWLGAQGGATIRPRSGRAVLIPINTITDRISTKKFYKIIDWLMQNKQTVIKDGVLYAVPDWNTSRRGGVAPGTRLNKKFRSRLQGSHKRPSGFNAMFKEVNGARLIPIALVRRQVRMSKKFSLPEVAHQSIVGIVRKHIEAELAK